MAKAWILPPQPIVTATASSTAVGYDPLYVGNDYAGVVWKSAAEASATLTIDLGADTPVDTIMLFGARGNLSAWTLKIELATSVQGQGFGSAAYVGPAATFLAGAAMPVSGRGVGIWSVAAPIVARYVRVTIAGMGGVAATISRALIGRRIAYERNFSFGAAFGVRDLGNVEFSRRGVLLRTRGAKLRTAGLTFSSIRKDEVESMTKPLMERLGNTEIVGVLTDPDAHEQRQNRAYAGPLVGDLSAAWRKADAFETKVNVVSLF